MKNLFLNLLLFLAIIFLVVGCSSDGDSIENESNLLIGVWKPVKYVAICDADTYFYYDYSSCKQKGLLTIKNDGAFTQANFYIEDFWQFCYEGDLALGTWVEENGSLVFTVNGDSTEYGFFELGKSSLKLGQYNKSLPECESESSHFYVEYVRVN